jgi:hypothetical protein
MHETTTACLKTVRASPTSLHNTEALCVQKSRLSICLTNSRQRVVQYRYVSPNTVQRVVCCSGLPGEVLHAPRLRRPMLHNLSVVGRAITSEPAALRAVRGLCITCCVCGCAALGWFATFARRACCKGWAHSDCLLLCAACGARVLHGVHVCGGGARLSTLAKRKTHDAATTQPRGSTTTGAATGAGMQ